MCNYYCNDCCVDVSDVMNHHADHWLVKKNKDKGKSNSDSIIKLDLDGKSSFSNFMSRIWILKYLGLCINTTEVFHTNNGYHVYIYTANKLDAKELLLIQTLLGSDYRHSLYSFLKYKNGIENEDQFNKLFKEKYKTNWFNEREKVSEEKYDKELSQKLYDNIILGT